MIKGGDLENRGPQADATPKTTRAAESKDAEELRILKARIAKIDALTITDANRLGQQIHCGHCWGEGRQAALKVLEGEDV